MEEHGDVLKQPSLEPSYLVLSSVDSCKAPLAYLVLDAEGTNHFVARPRTPGGRR